MTVRARLLALCVLVTATIVAPVRIGAQGSGNVEPSCNPAQAIHYANKARRLEMQGAHRDAAFAYAAAEKSLTCGRRDAAPMQYYFLANIARENYNTAISSHLPARDELIWLSQADSIVATANRSRAAIATVVKTLTPLDRNLAKTANAMLDDVARRTDQERARVVALANTQAAAERRARYAAMHVAGDCENDTISTVGDGGAFVATMEGGRYIIAPIDRIDTSLWLATDDVVVCDDSDGLKLIHQDDVVHARRVQ